MLQLLWCNQKRLLSLMSITSWEALIWLLSKRGLEKRRITPKCNWLHFSRRSYRSSGHIAFVLNTTRQGSYVARLHTVLLGSAYYCHHLTHAAGTIHLCNLYLSAVIKHSQEINMFTWCVKKNSQNKHSYRRKNNTQ